MKVWHYKIPSSGAGEGWAYIMIREDGFFATVSDYGNYAYIWTSTGKKDVREFFLRAGTDWDYFASKLRPERTLDVEASFKAVRQDISAELQAGRIDIAEVEEHNQYVSEFEDDGDWEGFLRDDRTLEYWDEPFRFGVMSRHQDVDNYAKKILPQLARLIQVELQAEGSTNPPLPTVDRTAP